MSEKYQKNYILLTGGAGYIGSSVAYYLLKSGKNVIILDNFSNSNCNNIESLPNKHNLVVLNINCCNYKSLENIFISYHIDVVVHFAGFKAVAESIQKPMLYYENNLISSINMLKICAEYDVRRFIFSSSFSNCIPIWLLFRSAPTMRMEKITRMIISAIR